MVMNIKDIIINKHLGRNKISILDNSTDKFLQLEPGVWNYAAIVSALVRTKYSEDDMEAIINNSISLLSSPSTVSDEETQEKQTEFQQMQEWREKCKARAKELLALGKEMGLEESYG